MSSKAKAAAPHRPRRRRSPRRIFLGACALYLLVRFSPRSSTPSSSSGPTSFPPASRCATTPNSSPTRRSGSPSAHAGAVPRERSHHHRPSPPGDVRRGGGEPQTRALHAVCLHDPLRAPGRHSLHRHHLALHRHWHDSLQPHVHAVWRLHDLVLPYIYQGIRNALNAIDANMLIQAAEMLGCGRFRAYVQVVCPTSSRASSSRACSPRASCLATSSSRNNIAGTNYQNIQVFLQANMARFERPLQRHRGHHLRRCRRGHRNRPQAPAKLTEQGRSSQDGLH